MICHLGDALASSSGPSPKPGTGWLSRFPYLDRLAGLLDSVAGRDPHGDWPASEVFGKLSGRDWGSLLWATSIITSRSSASDSA